MAQNMVWHSQWTNKLMGLHIKTTPDCDELRARDALTHPDLHEEVPDVLLEGGYVVVQAEHALHRQLDLVVGEVGEGGLEQ